MHNKSCTYRTANTYLVHLPTSTVFQNSKIPSTNSSLKCGFTTPWIYSFNLCHIFSSGFKSGDSGAVFHQFTLFASKKMLLTQMHALGHCPAWTYDLKQTSGLWMATRWYGVFLHTTQHPYSLQTHKSWLVHVKWCQPKHAPWQDVLVYKWRSGVVIQKHYKTWYQPLTEQSLYTGQFSKYLYFYSYQSMLWCNSWCLQTNVQKYIEPSKLWVLRKFLLWK